MSFIVLDLEWNQSPVGKSGEVPGLPFEIIEIGAVRMNEHLQIEDIFQEVVRPKVYRTLHFRTQKIVHLKQTDLTAARPFHEVAADFLSWCGPAPRFCTWGPSDLIELQRNLAYHGLPDPFPRPLYYYDIQKIFSIVYEERHIRRSLEHVVDSLDIAREIPFHSALSDAWYTSLVIKYLTPEQILENSSIDYYRTPTGKKDEIFVTYPTYSKYISRPFASRIQAMKDKILTQVPCLYCRKPAPLSLPWFSMGPRSCCALARCPDHGYLKGKIRFRHTENAKTYTIRTIRAVTDEEARELANSYSQISPRARKKI